MMLFEISYHPPAYRDRAATVAGYDDAIAIRNRQSRLALSAVLLPEKERRQARRARAASRPSHSAPPAWVAKRELRALPMPRSCVRDTRR